MEGKDEEREKEDGASDVGNTTYANFSSWVPREPWKTLLASSLFANPVCLLTPYIGVSSICLLLYPEMPFCSKFLKTFPHKEWSSQFARHPPSKGWLAYTSPCRNVYPLPASKSYPACYAPLKVFFSLALPFFYRMGFLLFLHESFLASHTPL